MRQTYREDRRISALRQSPMALSISGTALLQAASMGLGFVTSVLLSRMLGASGYGAYAYSMAWVGFLLIPAVMGMDWFLIRGVAMYQASRDPGLLHGLVRWANRSVLGVSAIIAVVAGAIGYVALPSSLRTTFCLAMPLVPLTALVTIRQSTLTGLSRVVTGQFPEFLLRPALFVLALIPFAVGAGVSPTPQLAMVLNVGAVIVAFAVGIAFLARAFPSEARAAEPTYERRAWLRASRPMMLLGGIWVVNGLVTTIMLGSLRGARDVGVYAVVFRLAEVMAIGLAAVAMPLSPRVAQLFALGDMAGLQRAVSNATKLCVAWSAPVALVLIVLSHPLLSVFGPQFAGAGLALAIVACGQFVNTAAGPAGILLMMTKHERAAAVGVGAGLLVNIALNALLVPSLGVDGAAIGSSASLIVWNGALVAYAAIRLRINTTLAIWPGRTASIEGAARSGQREIAQRAPMLPHRRIDFITIGAQKAGTRSLFERIRLHPHMYISPRRELRCSAPAVASAAAFTRWVSGCSKFSSPPASPLAGARAALEIVRGAPPLSVELTASPSGELIRDYLLVRWRGVRPHLHAQSILRIPPIGGPMLNGRRFRAARTNITRARHEGLTCRELSGPERRRVLHELTHPESILDWTVDRWWVCEEPDGSAAGLALATVDRDWALLNFLIARRHTARYLLHTHMVFSLQATGVKYLTHRGPTALIMPSGLLYFQARLGYEIVSLQVSSGRLTQSSAPA